jgi:hypothetical protein
MLSNCGAKERYNSEGKRKITAKTKYKTDMAASKTNKANF